MQKSRNILLLVLFFQTNAWSQTQVISKIEQSTILWNSVNSNYDQEHVYCTWDKVNTIELKLNRCYKKGFINFLTLGLYSYLGNTLTGEFTLITKDTITYNAKTCKVRMGYEVIGQYYGGKCASEYFSKGIEMTKALVVIDYVNNILTID